MKNLQEIIENMIVKQSYDKDNINYSKNKVEFTIALVDELIKDRVKMLSEERELHIISLSDDKASKSYMNNKLKIADNYEIPAMIHRPENRYELINILAELGSVDNTRVIIQCPFDEDKWGKLEDLMKMIPKKKDVDGFDFSLISLNNIKSFDDMINNPNFSPTAKGVLLLLGACFDFDIKGKSINVIGKGLTSGLPIATICEQLGATVYWCNSKTSKHTLESLSSITDIIISCAGVPNLINKDNAINKYNDAYYINVGMNKDENGKLKGDINYDEIIELPNTIFCNELFGSTGKLTTMCLILNTVL